MDNNKLNLLKKVDEEHDQPLELGKKINYDHITFHFKGENRSDKVSII